MSQYIIQNIKLSFETTKDDAFAVAKRRLSKFFPAKSIRDMNIYKTSVDARKKDNICFVYSVSATVTSDKAVDEKLLAKEGIVPLTEDPMDIRFGDTPLNNRPVIVGFGPCGMFCALILAENGYRPIVIERGSDVIKRTADVERFSNLGILDPESNIQFGAGGAGTFSDGKLVTRINDPKCSYVISAFHKFGAPEEILYKAKPHIGTDYLKIVVSRMEERIRELGGDIFFDTKLEDFKTVGNTVVSVLTNKGEIPCGALILALGHSARDTFAMLKARGVPMIAKAFSVGVRVEHLQEDIDYALYGKAAGDKRLPKGEYNLSCHSNDRGVYTFCMCPGGQVVSAASEEGGVVTNGMSNYARDGKNANSAVAVSVNPADYGETVEKAITFQRELEQRAYAAGGKTYFAPCQTVGDFLGKTHGKEPSRIAPSYRDGKVTITALDRVLPPFVGDALKYGLANFDKKIRGFAADDAVLTGVETRTSSPVRIPRDEQYRIAEFDNIYPCGEGAGYAGGITSAAVDGIKCALAFMARYKMK